MLKPVFCWHLWWWFLKWLKPLSWNKDREWRLKSVHNVAAAPFSPHSSPAPAWHPTLARQFSINFSVGPSHLFQFFKKCSSVGPCTGYCPSRIGCPSMGSARQPTSLRLVCELLLSSGHIHLLWLGILHQAAGGSCTITVPHGLKGHSCLTMVFTMGCRRISALVVGEPPTAPSALTLVSARLFLLHIFTVSTAVEKHFYPFLNIISESC